MNHYIQLQKIIHKGETIVLLRFRGREDWLSMVKGMRCIRFTKTHSSYFISYTKEAFAQFKALNIPYKLPPTNETADTLSSQSAVFDIEQGARPNVRSLQDNEHGDTSISARPKKRLEISWNLKGFSIDMPYDEEDILFVKSLEKAWWHETAKVWYVKNSVSNLKQIQKYWTYYDRDTYGKVYEAIMKSHDPNIIELYMTPEYPQKFVVKVIGYKSSHDMIKSLAQRQYDKVYRRWIIPYRKETIKEIVTFYEAKDYKVINNLLSEANKQESRTYKRIDRFVSKVNADRKPFFEAYTNIFLRQGKSQNTAVQYSAALWKIMEYYKVDDIAALDEHRTNTYLSTIAKAGVSDSALNRVVSAIKFWSKYMASSEDQWEIKEIKRPKKGFTIPKILSKEEMKAFLAALDNEKHTCILYLAYGSGLRANEVLNLKLSEIYWDRQQVLVSGSKGKKDRIVTMSQKLIDRMSSYFDRYQPVRYLFEGTKKGKPYSYSSLRQIVLRAKAKANINRKMGSHVLRHSFATHHMDAGTPLPYIQQLLGHKDIKTTMIYMHITKQKFEDYDSPLDSL